MYFRQETDRVSAQADPVKLSYTLKVINLAGLIKDIITTYQRHGWTLRQALLSSSNIDLKTQIQDLFKEATVKESDLDALWFARASTAKREGWELRLIAEQPYALFEAFAADEPDEVREERRLEMENRLRDYTARRS